ncbi:MAG: beta-ketoacyl-ACP synthase II [Actinomycetota bacterium]|nr:beta-ketoacyl-ACP synthase II [Actinomycetota bacterium]MEE2680630.1 beta-ketoacyl-ACP synthase II [Actinomycetota bacterium]MEE3187276.1 beta-ketoacyl-ACP synthase II [Actinomycetota bacterium]MEE3256766.1 beta-ketoacyl-ACP synthase II [Actinomycetota bacterium]
MSEGRRVAIVGLGVVSCAGIGLDAFWEGLNSAVPEGEKRVHDFDPLSYYDNTKEARRADRSQQMATATATMAFEDAGELTIDPARCGVIYATGVGGLQSFEEQVIVHDRKGARRVSPFMVPMIMPNAPGAAISMRFGLQGPNETITTACAASTHALGYGARLIQTGYADVIVSGGAESVMSPVGMAGFQNMTALSSSGKSMPFDRDRDGFMMTEGSATLILEEMESAQSRGAHIYGEILGSGSNADAHHVTAPAPGGHGAARCMQLAIEDAGLTSEEICYVNAHGTSTPLNDAAEAEAISKVFGENGPPVTSTKGVTGHALGAAGALEATSVLLSFQHRQIPPTAGFTVPDPDMAAINLVTGSARDWEPGPSMSNSFGFGGHNGCLVLAPLDT